MNQVGDHGMTEWPRSSDALAFPAKRPKPFRFATSEFTPRSAKQFDETVRRIEALGYSIFGIGDHLNPGSIAPVPALLAAACASSHLRVCTTVHDNNLRHPAMLAKEAATLDFLSDGRLEFGIGAGYARHTSTMPLVCRSTRRR